MPASSQAGCRGTYWSLLRRGLIKARTSTEAQLRKAFEQIGGSCVFTSEWDSYAQTTYKANYPDLHALAGDITQVDVPNGVSGLRTVTQILSEVPDIHFARLGAEDVVRHSLVGRIVDAYSAYDESVLTRKAGVQSTAQKRGRP